MSIKRGPFEMREIVIRLEGEIRADNSVLLKCPELPMFSVVGSSEEDAVDLAVAMLPMYLEANFGVIDEIRRAGSPRDLDAEHEANLLPAHIIASIREGRNAASGSTCNC